KMVNKSDFEGIVGAGSVADEAAVLRGFSCDHSYVAPRSPSLVVRPESPEQVRDIVKLANSKKVPLVPVSSGPPRFRGDSIPAVDGAVVLDLSGMKKIMWINRRNRVALVEAGVTFQELEMELEREGLRCMIPLLPRSTKSIVGAFMEREPFTVPKYSWDLGDPICSSEFILGDGYLTRTGGAAGPGKTLEDQRKVGGAHKLPFSPMFMDVKRIAQGSQGSYAICTWMALRCELLPEYERVYFVGADEPDKLIDASYRFMYLRLTDEMYLLNSLNFACMLETDAGKIDELKAKLPPWILVLSIGGYADLAAGQFDYKEADLGDEASRLGIELKTEIGGVTEARYRDSVVRKVSGEPYWKTRYKGDVREVFFLTSLSKVPEFIQAAADAAQASGFDTDCVGAYAQFVMQGSGCHLEFDLYGEPGDGLVEKFYAGLSKKVYAMGGYYSRPYGMWADLIYPDSEKFVKYARRLKRIFDPNLVMNPEKLCFKEM
ncbi:MAG: FAD-binding oxidoreductase, partial [Actinobacteria bacterium]|nr:FAD-binding oxidoreductase [Actinomycetota bacterium]